MGNHLDHRMLDGANKPKLFELVEETRGRFARLVRADPDQIGFTKNVSEGLNMVATGLDWRPGDNVILCPELEHPNNIYPWLNLRRLGVEVRAGAISAEDMLVRMDARTRAITVSSVTFAPGFRTDLDSLGRACHERGILFVVDAAQSVGVLATDVRRSCIDALSVSTQKGLLGLYGMGFLYCRREWAERMQPAYLARFGVDVGEAHEASMGEFEFRLQPSARRFDLGNYNFLAAAAANASIQYLLAWGSAAIETYVVGLAHTLARGMLELGLPVCFFDLANKCALPRFSTRVIQEYAAKQERNSGDKDEWFRTIEEARGRFAQLVNANPTEIALLKNTSEGLNVAANGIPFKAGENVVVNLSEHPNNIYCRLNLQRRGVEVRWAPTREGEVTVEPLAATADERTRALAIALVTYAPGNRNDVKALATFCRARGIYTVVDAVQAVGTLEVDVADLGVDMLATSGHKALFVPHGVGLFYCRRERLDDIAPFYVARSGIDRPVAVEHDSARYEIGNNNYLGITVLSESLKFLLDLGMARVERRILELSGYLTERLLAAGFEVLSPREAHRRSAIVCVQVAEPARVHAWLVARKVITTCRRDSLRLSLGIYNTEAEIDAFMDILKAYPE